MKKQTLKEILKMYEIKKEDFDILYKKLNDKKIKNLSKLKSPFFNDLWVCLEFKLDILIIYSFLVEKGYIKQMEE